MMDGKILFDKQGQEYYTELYTELESRLSERIQEVRDGKKTTEESVDLFLDYLHGKEDEAGKSVKSGKRTILIGILVAVGLLAIGALSNTTWLLILGVMSFGISVAGNEERKKGKARLVAANDFGKDHFGG